MRITIPGNLLLLGEYAVTLPNGLGIALAIDNAQVEIVVKPSDKLKIHSQYQGNEFSWEEGEPILDELNLPINILTGIHDMEVSIDSTQFSDSSGRKRGFGSSAAVCAGLSYLRFKHLYNKEPNLAVEVYPYALQMHRDFQGGKGSGYDVLASLMGGSHLFIGGEQPSWKKASTLPDFFLVQGDEPVETQGAVTKFQAFLQQNSQEGERFLEKSNRIVQEFCENPTKKAFEQAVELNHWLSKEIKVISEGTQLSVKLSHYREMGCPAKALGAGGEIAVVWGEALPLEKIQISMEGIKCQE